jgi:hypothetical protein
VASRWTVVEHFLYGKPHEYHRAAPPVMSRDGATVGHDAAVTRSVYGHPAPFHLGIAEKASPAASGPTP